MYIVERQGRVEKFRMHSKMSSLSIVTWDVVECSIQKLLRSTKKSVKRSFREKERLLIQLHTDKYRHKTIIKNMGKQ
jgi:hypothetical protein